jgi:hypothetical protein
MTSRFTPAIRAVAGAAIIIGFAVPAAKAQNTVQTLLAGDTKIEMLYSYKGTNLAKPAKTVVYNFDVPESVITMDNSAAARLLGRGIVSRRIKGDTNQDTSPEAVAQHVQASFSKALVSELAKTSIPAEIATSADANPSINSLVVHGDFTTVNQGNKSKRIMVGFGRGASDVQAHVVIFLVTDTQPVVLAEFNLKSESGKKPGAAATMGVGSAGLAVATGDVGNRKETVEVDASRMAKAVAKQIEDVMTAQQWIAPPQSQQSAQQSQAK